MSGENQYTFDLGGLTVTGLRIDPDSVGGVPTRLDGVVLNPVQPWYLRFVPNGGQWLLLLFAPAVGLRLPALPLMFSAKVKKSPVGRCAHGLGAHPQGFYVV